MIGFFNGTCIRWVLLPSTAAYIHLHRTDFTLVDRSGSARAGHVFYFFDDIYGRMVTSAHVLWPRCSTHRHEAPSPSFVFRLPWADRRFFLLPTAEPMTFRPAAAATSTPPFFLRGSVTWR